MECHAAGIVSTPSLINPGWRRKVFSVAGRDYLWLDVFLAGMLRGDWRRFEVRLLEHRACLAEARSRQAWPDASLIDEAATAFRHDRNLLTTDETLAWMEHAGLTLDDWTEFLVARLLRSQWNDRLGDLLHRHGEALTITDGAFSAEGICSGFFDDQARTLAGRAAVSATCVDMTCEPTDLAHIQRTRRDHAAWLASLGPGDIARLAHLARLEATFAAQAQAAISPTALAEQVARHRLEWMRVDLERLVFADTDAAREAAWCVREDGATLNDVAIESRLQVHDSRELLERLDPALRDVILAAGVGQLIGPVQVGSRHEVAWVVGKTTPDLNDPLVYARAAEAVVERLVTKAVLSHVHWAVRKLL
jgi:hypothetical protein